MTLTRLACRVATAFMIMTLVAAAQERQATEKANKQGEWLVFGNNEFALAMYAKVATTEKGNFCFSPFSTIRSQALLYAGAKGVTAAQIKSVMKLQLPASDLHPGMARLQKAIAKDAGSKTVHLLGANAVWPKFGAVLNSNYLKTLQATYGIDKVQPLDFENKPAISVERINNGVFLSTSQIETIVTPKEFDPQSDLILTEAVYYLARWRYRFVKTGQDLPFTADGKAIQIPMMTQTARLKYADLEKFEIVELPMKSTKFVVQILVPKEGKTLKDVESELAVYNFYGWGKRVKDAKVTVNLPIIDLATSMDVAPTLKNMGLKIAFEADKADFTGLTNKKLALSHIYQKAYFSFKTSGSRSPAVSLGRSKLPEVKVEANRPFIFIAKHKPTNSILLMGRISGPGSTEKE